MAICTFFGHKNIDIQIEPILKDTIIDLIENKNVKLFYVGNHGDFDYIVINTLSHIKANFPHINFAVVLAYLPNMNNKNEFLNYADAIYPDGIEYTPPKYAIIKRNRWMIEKSDYVITYVKHNFGGAAKFQEIAQKKGKIIINIANSETPMPS